MVSITSFLINYMLFFLIALISIIIYKMVTGAINTGNLLNDCSGKFSPGRLQLLITVIYSGFSYINIVFHTKTELLNTLPPLPPETLYIFGGSSLIYLTGKINSTNIFNLFFNK